MIEENTRRDCFGIVSSACWQERSEGRREVFQTSRFTLRTSLINRSKKSNDGSLARMPLDGKPSSMVVKQNYSQFWLSDENLLIKKKRKRKRVKIKKKISISSIRIQRRKRMSVSRTL